MVILTRRPLCTKEQWLPEKGSRAAPPALCCMSSLVLKPNLGSTCLCLQDKPNQLTATSCSHLVPVTPPARPSPDLKVHQAVFKWTSLLVHNKNYESINQAVDLWEIFGMQKSTLHHFYNKSTNRQNQYFFIIIFYYLKHLLLSSFKTFFFPENVFKKLMQKQFFF